ncbi:MAG: RND transporter [Oceanicaulis sp.]|uniref:RND transporter n=2 Tax=Maricaulis virginensis TaxID=144022 RepID=A0A9W6IKP0_9PROT|nr:RND transporter [Oceanicaulis sp.]GLK51274.1 RND transporter [Maricaulis virginensis]
MGAIRNRTDMFATALAEAMIRWRWIVILATILATVGFAMGMPRLAFDTNYRAFFSDENPELAAFENFQATYTKNDNFLIVVRPADGNVFSQTTLAAVEEITEAGWQVPYAIRVDSITNFQHTWADGDNLIVEDLVRDAHTLSDTELSERSAVALNEPLLRNQLITEDASVTAINIVLQYPEESAMEVPEAVAVVRALRDRIEADYPDIDIALSGVSMMNNAFMESGMGDMAKLIPLMYLVLLAIMMVAIRSVSGTIATLFLILFSSIVSMGSAGFLAIGLTPVSASAPTIVLTLAIADSIHILMSMRQRMRDGLPRRDAIVDAVRINFLAVTITSLTTIIGFMALNLSDAPPFGHLGTMTAIGIAAAWLLSITFLPAIVSVLPMKAAPRKPDGKDATARMGQLAGFVTRHSRGVLIASAAASAALIALIPTIEFNDQWVNYFSPSLEVRQDNDTALEYFGLYPIEFSVPADGAGGVSDPVYLERLDAFASWARQQDGVTHVYSITDIMRRLNRNMHEDDPAYFRIPEDRSLAAQYLLLYELSLPYGLDLNDRINIDKSATRMTVTLDNVTTQETKDFLDAAEAWLAENTPDYMHTSATGAQVMFAYVAERNVNSMISGNIIAILAIGLVMVMALRSFRLGLLSLIPNTLPILTTFGTWALLVGTVGFSVAAVGAVSLGIVVDDTVHFLTKYRRARMERGASTAEAIRYAFETVGMAVVINTIILAAGFAVLAMSTFKLNADMGLLTALAIVFALVLDFLLLPALLVELSKLTAPKPQSGEKSNEDRDYQPVA